MQAKSVGIFANPNNDGALAAVSAVYGAASERGIDCFIDESFSDMPEFRNYETIQRRTPELMAAIGGDGTILRAAAYAAEHEIPILGINFGRIGFLSEITVDGIGEALDAVRNDRFRADRCMMLSCSVNDEAGRNCLNEAVLYRKKFTGVVSITVKVDGVNAGTVSCDGLIVATPTGSTGYSISAGGPVIAPGADVLIINPICPHTLAFRPIVAPGDAQIELSIDQEGFLGLDGVSTERVIKGDTVKICRSDRKTTFIRFNERNLYSLIKSKLS